MRWFSLWILFLCLSSGVFISPKLQAAILPAKNVFEKLLDKRGFAGLYMEKEILWPSSSLVLKEKWWVLDEGRLKLMVSKASGEVLYSVIYEDQMRIYRNLGRLERKSLSYSSFEIFLNIRRMETLMDWLVSLKILPQGALLSKASSREEAFVQLARSNGVVNYGYGYLSIPGNETHPRLWIEQDAFVMRRLRMPDGVEARWDLYELYGKNILPQREKFQFPWGIVSLQLKSAQVRKISPSIFEDSGLENIQFSSIEDLNIRNQVEEFYLRYR